MTSERSKLGRWVGMALATATLVVGGVAVVACSNGGEGDACNHLADNNGDDDCQNGLICTTQQQLANGAGTNLCCPSNRALATTAACAIAQSPPGVDAAIPADSAPASDSASDAAAQSDGAATDGPAADSASNDASTPDGDDGG